MNDGDAYRTLGAVFIKGYFKTIIGRLTGVVIPIIGPEKTLQRAQKLWRIGDPCISMTSKELGPKRWRVDYQNPFIPADCMAGGLESAVQLAAPTTRVTVLAESTTDGQLLVEWTLSPSVVPSDVTLS